MMMPFVIQTVRGLFTESMMNSRVAGCAVLFFLLCSRLISSEPPSAPDANRVVAEFDIAKNGDLILLPVSIMGKEYPFVLSTAAARTAVDVRLRRILGEPIGQRSGATADGKLEYTEYDPVAMKIGNIEFKASRPLVCSDLAHMRAVMGHDIYGLVGQDFLRDRIIEIDFDAGKFRVVASVEPADGTDSRTLVRTERGHAAIFSIPGLARQLFVIDTGATPPVCITPLAVDVLIERGLAAGIERSEYIATAGKFLRRTGRLRSFAFNDWELPGVRFLESNGETVGLEYLARFRVTLDYEEGFVYLSPGKRFDRPEPRDWSRMSIAVLDGDVVVRFVAAGAVADHAGIKEGDVLTKVNGRAATEFTLFEIRALLSESQPVRLHVRRGADMQIVELAPTQVKKLGDRR
jgi:hypothetical protein